MRFVRRSFFGVRERWGESEPPGNRSGGGGEAIGGAERRTAREAPAVARENRAKSPAAKKGKAAAKGAAAKGGAKGGGKAAKACQGEDADDNTTATLIERWCKCL